MRSTWHFHVLGGEVYDSGSVLDCWKILGLITFPWFLCPGSLFGVVAFCSFVIWPIICFWLLWQLKTIFWIWFSFIIGSIGFGLWFECINMDLFSMVWRHITWLCISIGLPLVFFVSAWHRRASLLSLEAWFCCFMVLLVWSLFNIWPPSIVDYGSSLHLVFLISARHWKGTTFIFGTLVLYITSFHCRLWLFLALLFGYHHWFWISLFFLSCASILSSWELLMVKRCALIGFVDIGFYRMVVKRCLVDSSFNWFNLELWLLLVG